MKRDGKQGAAKKENIRQISESLSDMPASSAAKRWGDCCVFTNMADEVMVQRGTEADWTTG